MFKHNLKILLRNLFFYIMWIILLLVVRRVYSQDTWNNWEFYEVPDRAPKQIVIDREDRKWIAVVNGVQVFNGEQWVKYSKNNSGLTDYTIHTMMVDGDGGIWFGTNNGATRFDGETWTTFNTSNSGIADDRITYLACDRQGGLWFSSLNEISHFDGIVWNAYAEINYPFGSINSIAVDSENTAWFGTSRGGLMLFDTRLLRMYTTNNSGIVSNFVTTVCIAPNDKLMIGTGSGISEFDGVHWKSWNDGRESGISGGDVLAIEFDSNGLAWIATEFGFSCYDGETWASFPIYNTPMEEDDPTGRNRVRDLAIDKYDNVWLVTNKGLYRYIPEFLQITGSCSDEIFNPGESVKLTWLTTRIRNVKIEYIINDGDTWHEIKSEIDNEEKIYIYTIPFDIIPPGYYSLKMTIRISSPDSPEIYDETSFYVEDKDLLDSFVTFTPYNSGLVSTYISSIYEDRNGVIWFGTGEGVSGYNGSEWTTFTSENSGLISNRVSKIFEDRNGVIWFKTDNGISGYNGTEWTTFTPDNSGLISKYVNHMVSAPDGSLWFATPGGLSQFDGETWTTWFEGESILYLGVDRRGRVYTLFHRFDDDTQKAACYWHSRHEWEIVAYDGEKWVQEAKEYSLINVFGTDPDGCLWIAAFDDKMIKYDGISWCVYPCPQDVFWAFSDYIIWGDDGTIWIHDNERLYSFGGRGWNNYPFPASFSPVSMAAAPDGSVWCVDYNDGIAVFDGANWKTCLREHGWPLSSKHSIFVDSNNVKWFAGYDGVTRFDVSTMTMVKKALIPEELTVIKNYPNPFNPSTTITFPLKNDSFARLCIYNIMGQKVRELVSEYLPAGTHEIVWDGRDDSGSPVSAGIYLTRLVSGNVTASGRMMLLK